MKAKTTILVGIVVLAVGIAVPSLAINGVDLEPLDYAMDGTPRYACGNGTINENPLSATEVHFNSPPTRLLRSLGLFKPVVSRQNEKGFLVTVYTLFGIPLTRAFYSCEGNTCSGSSCAS